MSDASIWKSRPVSSPRSNRSIERFVGVRVRSAYFAGFAWLVVSLGGGASAWADEPPRPSESRLRAIVKELASPAYEGRRGAGGVKAGDYLIGQFRQLKLQPLFQGEFVQTVPGKEPGTTIGRNVGAMLRGSDPALRDQWVIVAAHFDHLGVKNGRLYPGADDNASGVAMMLEVARAASSRAALGRSGA